MKEDSDDELNIFDMILKDPELNSSFDSDKLTSRPAAQQEPPVTLPFKDTVKYDIFKKQNNYLDDRLKGRKFGETRASFLANRKPMVFLKEGPVEPHTTKVDASLSARNAVKSAGSRLSQLSSSPRVKEAEPTKYRRNPNIEDFLKDIRAERRSAGSRKLEDGLTSEARGHVNLPSVINIIPATPLPTETPTPKDEPSQVVKFDKNVKDAAKAPLPAFRSVTENFHQKLNEKLKLTLMSEFGAFLDEKASKAAKEIKRQNQLDDSDEEPSTQDPVRGNKTFLTELNDPNMTQSFAELTNRSTGGQQLGSTRKYFGNDFEKFYQKEEAQKADKASSTEPLVKTAAPSSNMELVPLEDGNKTNKFNSMQIALLSNEDNSLNASSLIQLNKMIESIKRIDLPNFQTELHQICQYGADGQLLKFYPDVVSFRSSTLD